MPQLTEEERQEILARRQQGTTAPPSTGFSPYPGLTLQSVTVGKTPSIRLRPDPTQQFVREQQLKNLYPTLTEIERERTPMAQQSVKFLDDFAQQLGVDEEQGTIAHPELLAVSRDIFNKPNLISEVVQSPETKNLYNSLESAFNLGSVVLTGRQGDIQKLQQLRDVYRFGAALRDQPQVIIQRLKNLRTLFNTFDRSQRASPEAKQRLLSQASQQMDRLLADPNLDPNLLSLQQQFPGATIRRKR